MSIGISKIISRKPYKETPKISLVFVQSDISKPYKNGHTVLYNMPSLDRPGRWKPGAEASQHQRPGARPAEQIAGAGSKGRAEERKRKNDRKRDGRTARTAERWKLDRITDDGRSAGVGGRWKLDSRSQEQSRTRRRGARHWRRCQEQRRGDGETLEELDRGRGERDGSLQK